MLSLLRAPCHCQELRYRYGLLLFAKEVPLGVTASSAEGSAGVDCHLHGPVAP